ncbi:MAG: histidine--tRNA ligase [Gammaproteobacteria bacterium]|nr:histidine--tRNA ligase [Gammaproteobacteria bacterium]
MSAPLQAVRGISDILPADSGRWHWLEQTIREVIAGCGYHEIRLPLLERTELFQRSIGDLTDIVQKEMYTFTDRNGDELSLRPEGTASCVRAALQHGLLQQPQRLWYQGPMFRHERPQKGRYRQFHQIGVEAFGFPGPDIDAELITLSARLWRALGIDAVRLEINSLGTPDERQQYRRELQDYFRRHEAELDDDSRSRLERNPLRILDSKNPALQQLVAAAPLFEQHLGAESRAHDAHLRRLLDAAGVVYHHNPRLVRGLDYYTHTVYEWVTDQLGAQGTICAGGRYDGLVAQFGGKPTPAVGFALGLERVLELATGAPAPGEAAADCYLMPLDATAELVALRLAGQLRDALPRRRIVLHCGGGSLRAQMKRADRSGAALGLILGADECARGEVSLKYLRADRPQEALSLDAVVARLQAEFARV